MAQIAKIVAQQGLDEGAEPSVRVSGALADAVSGLGGAVSNVGEMLAERQKKQEDFKDQNNYRLFQLQTGQQLSDAADSIAPDGTGFHDSFVQNIYSPARDKFLAGVSPRNREKFATLVGPGGSDTEEWSIKAAETQHKQATIWTKQQIEDTQNQLSNAISKNPSGYDAYLQEGYKVIDSAPNITTAERMAQRKNWEDFAMTSYAERQIVDDPEGFLRDAGADPRMLSPPTQFSMLKKSLVIQESGGASGAISPKGAVGIMQVMPGTAIDIAKEIHDENFDPRWNAQQITEYLSNPTVNQRYGDYYLKKQIRDFGPRGGLEAALIAYNGGPARAEAWIRAGRDDSVIPKESADYYKAVMSRLPGVAPAGKGDPKGVELVFARPTGAGPLAGQDENHLNPDLSNRVKTSFAALGINRVRINSGYRNEEDNQRVGGAEHSQHLGGNAVDIDVSGYTFEERRQIIQTLSANGITGLGIGKNMIHADLGGRRAWGYATSSGGGAVPTWAQGVIADHLANKTVAPTSQLPGASGRYAGMDYSKRQQLINRAGNEVDRRYREEAKATAVQRVTVQQQMQNELASIQNSGQSTGFDDTLVSTVLGEDDYLKWAEKKQTAQRMFAAKDGITGMTTEEMDNRLKDYTPNPGSDTYASDEQVHAAVQKEIDRVTRLRAQHPDEAAQEFPEVKAARDQVEAGVAQGKTDPAQVQAFVAAMLNRQKDFNLKPGSEAPIPHDWAMDIGRRLSRVPELTGKNLPDVTSALVVQYKALQQAFGPYTDEVILYALSQYKGIGKNTAELINGYMQSIQAGGDPLHLDPSRNRDRDQVESTSDAGWWQSTKNAWNAWFGDEAAADKILRPLAQGEQRNNSDGSYSTEITTTWQTPDGKWVNVPSLWAGPDGKTKQFDPGDEDGIMNAMVDYERQTGKRFPRYDTVQEAEAAAKARTQAGGAGSGPLASDAADLSPERLLRVIEALNNADTSEEEAAIVNRYGQAAVDAAKARIKGGQQ